MNSLVDITDTQQITSTSKGIVGTTWSAGEGASRQQAIAEARIQAHEEHLKQMKEREPFNARLIELEKTVAKLEAQVKLLSSACSGEHAK